MALVLSDMAGLGETNSPTLHDMLATIKGHVPEGHTVLDTLLHGSHAVTKHLTVNKQKENQEYVPKKPHR